MLTSLLSGKASSRATRKEVKMKKRLRSSLLVLNEAMVFSFAAQMGAKLFLLYLQEQREPLLPH